MPTTQRRTRPRKSLTTLKATAARAAGAHLLVEGLELFLEQVDLPLLACHGEIERVEQVVLEGNLDF